MPGEPRRFLICRLDAMGDVVMTTPLFRELKRAFPASHCTVVVREPYRPLLATNPHIDCILTLPSREESGVAGRLQNLLAVWKFCRSQLAHSSFDVALSPRWDTDEDLATLLSVASGARVRAGYTAQTSPEKARLNAGFDAAFTLCLPAGPARHEVLRNLAMVEALGGTVERRSPGNPRYRAGPRGGSAAAGQCGSGQKAYRAGHRRCQPRTLLAAGALRRASSAAGAAAADSAGAAVLGRRTRPGRGAGAATADAGHSRRRPAAARGLRRAGALPSVCGQRQRLRASGCGYELPDGGHLAPPDFGRCQPSQQPGTVCALLPLVAGAATGSAR